MNCRSITILIVITVISLSFASELQILSVGDFQFKVFSTSEHSVSNQGDVASLKHVASVSPLPMGHLQVQCANVRVDAIRKQLILGLCKDVVLGALKCQPKNDAATIIIAEDGAVTFLGEWHVSIP
jgi:hypothetical protein